MEALVRPKLAAFSALIVLLASSQEITAGIVQGEHVKPVQCLMEDGLHPYFVSSAGNYNPDYVSVELCLETCYKLKFAWAGLTQGRYCLCSSHEGFPGSMEHQQGPCQLKCPKGLDAPCGGKNGEISVYDTQTFAISHHLMHQISPRGLAGQQWPAGEHTDGKDPIGNNLVSNTDPSLPTFLSGGQHTSNRMFDEL